MTDWSKLTVVKLKEELKERGLSTAGLKAQLVSRLEEDDAAPASAPEEVDPTPPAAVEESAAGDKLPSPEAPSGKSSSEAEGGEPAQDVASDDVGSTGVASQDTHTGTVPAKPEEDARTKEEATQEAAPMIGSTQAQEQRASQSPPRPDDAIPGVATQAEDPGTQAAQMPQDVKSRTVERSQSIIPETQTSVDIQEVLEDSRKRKRRSRSPAPLTQDIAMKKIRAEDGSPRAKVPDEPIEVQPMASDAMELTVEPESEKKAPPPDARFKGLLASNQKTTTEKPVGNAEPSRNVESATHPETAALYIRNLMRPLQPTSLREHLKTLAQPEATDGEEDIIQEFYLDSIKSHCLVQFRTPSAAAAVRTALHDTVWPEEKSRKPLWVDYVPEAKLKEWIEVELDSAGSRPPKRWEIIYEKEHDGVVAYLQEADSAGPRRDSNLHVRNTTNNTHRPDPKPPSPKGDAGQGFQALDDLFRSTTAKPKLYFLPVPASVVEAREARLDAARGSGRNDEMRRFTFEGTDIVDDGPEFRPGYRGGGGGRGRGAFPGRGRSRGDSWRGAREG